MYFALCCTHSVVQATVWQALSACSTKVAGPHAYCKAREACRHTSTSELYEALAACASRLPLCTAGHVRMPGVEPGSQAWEACMIPLHYMRFRNQKWLGCHRGHAIPVWRHAIYRVWRHAAWSA